MDVVVRRTRLAVAVGPFVLRRVLRDLVESTICELFLVHKIGRLIELLAVRVLLW